MDVTLKLSSWGVSDGKCAQRDDMEAKIEVRISLNVA